MNEQIALVQAYIKHMKNVDVDISIRTHRDMILLQQAYSTAVNWFHNNGKVTYL